MFGWGKPDRARIVAELNEREAPSRAAEIEHVAAEVQQRHAETRERGRWIGRVVSALADERHHNHLRERLELLDWPTTGRTP